MITENHEYCVSFEVAELLKEAGFDWEVNHYYFTQNGKTEAKSDFRHPAQNYNESMATMDSKSFEFEVCSRPTLDVAQRWLREIKNFDVYICPINGVYFVYIRKYLEPVETKCEYSEYPNKFVCHTYEEALEAGIKKCLELILEKRE